MAGPDIAASIKDRAKYWQTMIFAITALLVMAITAIIAVMNINGVAAVLVEKGVIGLAEENARRDACHFQALISEARGPADDEAVRGEMSPLDLDTLIGSNGLPEHFAHLLEGMGIVESNLYSPAGNVLWSTQFDVVGQANLTPSEVNDALAGYTWSKLKKNQEYVWKDGPVAIFDVVDIYLPLRDSPTVPVMAVLEINREVGADLAQQESESKALVM